MRNGDENADDIAGRFTGTYTGADARSCKYGTTSEITDKKGKGLPESGKGEALEIPHSPEKEPVSCLIDWHYSSNGDVNTWRCQRTAEKTHLTRSKKRIIRQQHNISSSSRHACAIDRGWNAAGRSSLYIFGNGRTAHQYLNVYQRSGELEQHEQNLQANILHGLEQRRFQFKYPRIVLWVLPFSLSF